jgi:hypothetical protein
MCRTVDLRWLLRLDWGKKGLITKANIQELQYLEVIAGEDYVR